MDNWVLTVEFGEGYSPDDMTLEVTFGTCDDEENLVELTTADDEIVLGR